MSHVIRTVRVQRLHRVALKALSCQQVFKHIGAEHRTNALVCLPSLLALCCVVVVLGVAVLSAFSSCSACRWVRMAVELESHWPK